MPAWSGNSKGSTKMNTSYGSYFTYEAHMTAREFRYNLFRYKIGVNQLRRGTSENGKRGGDRLMSRMWAAVEYGSPPVYHNKLEHLPEVRYPTEVDRKGSLMMAHPLDAA